MLKLDKLSKVFIEIQAVNNVNLEIKPGEIMALIGPNGSGKTTIIKMIAGLLMPDSGRITVNGHDTRKAPVSAKAAIGYIPDEPAIWPAMTGLEYLHFSGALFNVSSREREKQIPKLLNLFHLEGIENGYFEDFSRGNKQKFTILAALLHQPKLLLIDEPIVGLDPVSAEIAEAEFTKFAHDGGAILLVTHTLSVAKNIAHRVGVLKTGELITQGSYDELREQAKLSEGADLKEIYKVLTV